MKVCYCCEEYITEKNSSIEHIILNACGGRLKSKSLICKNCNSKFGNSFDNELAKSTNDIANLLMIKRDKGKPQNIKGKTDSGIEYQVKFDGTPIQSRATYEYVEVDGKNTINIVAPNEKQFLKLLKGLKRKHPNLDIDSAIKSKKVSKKHFDKAIEVTSFIGGEKVFKSITKTAINFFMLNGGDRIYIHHLLNYLEGKVEADVTWFHYPPNEIYKTKEDEVTHVIKVVGNPKERILYAYIELFNIQNFIVKLNTEYDGSELDIDYVFDVKNYNTQQKVTNLSLSRSELIDLFQNKDGSIHSHIQLKYNRVLKIAYKIIYKYELNQAISQSVDRVLGKYKTGTVTNQDIMEEMRKDFLNTIVPLITNIFTKK